MFPEPVLITVVPIYGFGIFAALGLAFGYYTTSKCLRRDGIPTEQLPDFAFVVIVPAFISARIFFVLMHWQDYATEPQHILKFWEGGLIQYGGILGGILGGYYFCHKRSWPFMKMADAVALGLAFGFAISRLGCLTAGCCYGKPTDLPWGIAFHHPLSLAHPQNVPLHPTQIYSAIAEMILFLLLFRIRKDFEGKIFLLYLMGGSFLRFGAEFFRGEFEISNLIVLTCAFLTSFLVYLAISSKKLKPNYGGIMNIRSSTQLILLASFVVLSSACGIISTQKVTRGHEINTADANSIMAGKTTEKEILKMFGPPTKVRDSADGGKEYLYEYAKSGGVKWNLLFSVGGGTETRTLIVWLNKDNVVTDYAFKKS